MSGRTVYAYVRGNPISHIDPRGLAPPEEEDFPPESAEENDPLADIEYQFLLSQIRSYEPGFEDQTWRSSNSPMTRADVVSLQDVLKDLKDDGACRAPNAPRDFRRKPGSLGQFKGADALRSENAQAADAAAIAGLSQDQAQQLHQEISGQNLSFAQILEVAVVIKNGKN